ncbi:MAG: copper homeostasis protein CutC [Planctomycetes bacterium]|nr:copper homeostasis protein CutC [Planctomycetota bacterium]
MSTLIEACVDSVESAMAAESAGAHRLELCGNLAEGGCTPSLGLLDVVLQRVVIPVMVMIRPRGGDFCYSDDEFLVMETDLRQAREHGADGAVFGLLTLDGEVDLPRTQRMVELAQPLDCTFHRAFDLAVDPLAAVEQLIASGVTRLLSSGQQATAIAGRECLRRLVDRAAGRIKIMAGGGVRPEHVGDLVRETGVREVHVNGGATRRSPMRFRRDGLCFGLETIGDEYRTAGENSQRIRQCVAQLDSLAQPGGRQ